MIPTYNPTEHLRETILSAQAALARVGEGAQLEVVDDASPVDVGLLLRLWGLWARSRFTDDRATEGSVPAGTNASSTRPAT